jgi:hypothetical protein
MVEKMFFIIMSQGKEDCVYKYHTTEKHDLFKVRLLHYKKLVLPD